MVRVVVIMSSLVNVQVKMLIVECDNVFLGRYAGIGNTTASGNIFIGHKSGSQTSDGSYDDGGCNIAIGVEAGCGLNQYWSICSRIQH